MGTHSGLVIISSWQSSPVTIKELHHFYTLLSPPSLHIFPLMVGCCYQKRGPDSIYYSPGTEFQARRQCTGTELLPSLPRTTSINLQQSFKLILPESCNDPQDPQAKFEQVYNFGSKLCVHQRPMFFNHKANNSLSKLSGRLRYTFTPKKLG